MKRRYSHAKKPVLLHKSLGGRRYRWGTTEDEHMELVRDVKKAWEDHLESVGKSRTAWREGEYPTSSWETARLLQEVNPEKYGKMKQRKNLARMINRHFKRRFGAH
jgi:hypothetical protein